MSLNHVLEDAETTVSIIENTIEQYTPENYYDGLVPPPKHVSLKDCEFPEHITDPLSAIRHVKGEERAQWLEYEDDLETIAQEIEICARELKGSKNANINGRSKGAE